MSILRGENKKTPVITIFSAHAESPKEQWRNPVEIMKGRIAGFLDSVPFASLPALSSE
jgi:hypothetical protein